MTTPRHRALPPPAPVVPPSPASPPSPPAPCAPAAPPITTPQQPPLLAWVANLSKVQVNTTHVMCVQVTSGEKWSKQVEDFGATAEVYRVANDCDEYCEQFCSQQPTGWLVPDANLSSPRFRSLCDGGDWSAAFLDALEKELDGAAASDAADGTMSAAVEHAPHGHTPPTTKGDGSLFPMILVIGVIVFLMHTFLKSKPNGKSGGGLGGRGNPDEEGMSMMYTMDNGRPRRGLHSSTGMTNQDDDDAML